MSSHPPTAPVLRLVRSAVAVAAVTGLAGLAVGASAAPRPAPEPAITMGTPMTSPAGSLAAGPRRNGTGVLPDGRFVTPAGRTWKVQLQPQNEVLSADGRRLYVSSEGYNDAPDLTQHDNAPKVRYVTVLDTRTGATSRLRDDALHAGMAESRDGRTLFVSEGKTDSIGVFRRTPPTRDRGAPGTYRKVTSVVLNPSNKVDYPWGLTLSPDGRFLYSVGFSSNTLSVVDTRSLTVTARVATGEYPVSVAVSPDGERVYVSNWGLYNVDAQHQRLQGQAPVDPPPASIGGYNTTRSSSVWTYDVSTGTPSVVAKTKIGRDLNGDDVLGGSLPSSLAISPDGRSLAVTAANQDLLEVLDTTRTVTDLEHAQAAAHPAHVVDLRVLTGGPTGATPDAVTWAKNGTMLLVAEAGRNSVAVIDARAVLASPTVGPSRAGGATAPASVVKGRIPTAWYPTAVTVSPNGTLWVTTLQGLGSGPNAASVEDPTPGTSARAYDPDTLFGSVSAVRLAQALRALPSLTRTVDKDNGLVPARTGAGTPLGDGSVVPTAFGKPSSTIKHVFLVIKENRTFDQILGDLAMPGVERDQALAFYGKKVTPNAHAIATRFGIGDNFYATSEVSTDGHYSVDTGQVTDFLQKVITSSYAGKLPYGAFDTTAENLPQGGFIWDNAARHGVQTRVWGEGTYVVGIGPEELAKGTNTTPTGLFQPGVTAASVTYSPGYSSQVDLQGKVPTSQGVALANTVDPYNDEGRAAEFKRELRAFAAAGTMPALNVMVLPDDHTMGYLPGHSSPEDHIAENDHALGEILDTLSHSPFWKDSAMFVTEDDTQSGQDHVDAHRTVDLVASPYAAEGHVSHVHASFASMLKTIDLLLGLPPTSIQELTASSMASWFVDAHSKPDLRPYITVPNAMVDWTNPLPAAAPNALAREAALLALATPQGIDNGGDMITRDLIIGHAAAVQAGVDPNVQNPTPQRVRALQWGSPQPVGGLMRPEEWSDSEAR